MKQILIVLGLILCLFGMLSHEVKAEEVVTQPIDEVVDETVEDDVVGDEVQDEPIVEEPTVPVEPEEPNEEVPPTDEPLDDEVTIQEMFEDFKEKWLSPIFTALAGTLATLITVFLSKGVVNKLGIQMVGMVNATDEEKKKVLGEYKQAQKDLDDTKVALKEQVTNTIETFKNAYADSQTMLNKITAESKTMVENIVKQTQNVIEEVKKENADLIEKNKELFAKLTEQKVQVEDFKVLIGYLVSGTPQLASNGYATKILELLNEGSVNNVKEEI